jgi:predicted transcriptional regulator
MQQERSRAQKKDEARNDWFILGLLVDQDEQRPWSVDELVRELGKQVAVIDAIDRLHGAGLIHRVDELVFPSRTAIRYSQIAG